MNHAGDQSCIAAVLAGDVNAFTGLVERYQGPVYTLMVRMTGSRMDAQDLAQEAFMRAYEQLHRFQAGRRFFPWLYTIALNCARNHLRRRAARPACGWEDCGAEARLERLDDPPGGQEDALCARLDAHHLYRALGQLPEDYREAVVLRYHYDCTMAEIGEALELSISGAKMRVHRGLKQLREIMMGGDDGAEKQKSPAV